MIGGRSVAQHIEERVANREAVVVVVDEADFRNLFMKRFTRERVVVTDRRYRRARPRPSQGGCAMVVPHKMTLRSDPQLI